MQSAQKHDFPIDVVAALKGSPFEEVAEQLAAEFKKARITTLDQVGNAPLRGITTHGADLYEVMRIVTSYAEVRVPFLEEAEVPVRSSGRRALGKGAAG